MKHSELPDMIAAVREMGGSVALNRRDAVIHIDAGGMFSVPDSTFLCSSREVLFDFLNTFETGFRIVLNGVPACFLPGAEDHIEYGADGEHGRIRQCSSCFLRKTCRGLAKGLTLTRSFEEKLLPVKDSPREICIEVTGLCNHHCRACFSHGKCTGPSTGLILEVLGQARRAGVGIVRFTGGEPLLRGNLPELLACAKEKDFFTILNTNATLLDGEKLSSLEENVDDVLVSLQGCDNETERYLCGTGELFRPKLLNIARLRRSKIPVLRLGTVISHVLLDNFRRYRDLVEFLRPQQWEFYRPMLRADEREAAFDIGAEDIMRLLDMLDRARLGDMELKIANPVPLCLFSARRRNTRFFGASFDDGHTRLVLDARGFVKPSYCMDVNLGRNVAAAWNSSFMRRLRDNASLPASCRACAEVGKCMGASRFAAYAVSGDYFAPDPWMVVP